MTSRSHSHYTRRGAGTCQGSVDAPKASTATTPARQAGGSFPSLSGSINTYDVSPWSLTHRVWGQPLNEESPMSQWYDSTPCDHTIPGNPWGGVWHTQTLPGACNKANAASYGIAGFPDAKLSAGVRRTPADAMRRVLMENAALREKLRQMGGGN